MSLKRATIILACIVFLRLCTGCRQGEVTSQSGQLCFRREKRELTWDDANRECLKNAGTLALLKTEQDFEEVSKVFGDEDFWIGLRRLRKELPWMWADQTMPELWFYEKSGVEESDNGCCAYVDKKKWYSKDCQRKQDAFVCEFTNTDVRTMQPTLPTAAMESTTFPQGTPTAELSDDVCPSGYTAGIDEKYCYKWYDRKAKFLQAMDLCQNEGFTRSRLAHIETMREWKHLEKKLPDEDYWIGLIYHTVDSATRWYWFEYNQTLKVMDDDLWSVLQVSGNPYDKPYAYVDDGSSNARRWKITKGDDEIRYICQSNANTNPTSTPIPVTTPSAATGIITTEPSTVTTALTTVTTALTTVTTALTTVTTALTTVTTASLSTAPWTTERSTPTTRVTPTTNQLPTSGKPIFERCGFNATNAMERGILLRMGEHFCNLSLVDSLEKVLNLTKGRMKDGEILVIVTFLRDFVSANMSNYIDQSRLNTTIQIFADIANGLLDVRHAASWSNLTSHTSAGGLLLGATNRASFLAAHRMLRTNQTQAIERSNMIFDMRKEEFGEFREYRYLNKSDHGNQLFFSRADLEHLNLSDHDNVTIVGTIFAGLHRILPSQLDSKRRGQQKSAINSEVLSLDVGLNGHVTSIPVTFELRNHEISFEESHCSYWVFASEEQSGHWSRSGCRRVNTNGKQTTCRCDHTTNFALLINPSAKQHSAEDDKALRIITFTCCTFSIICLFVSLTILMLLSSLQSEHITIHKNFIAALLFAQIMLLAGSAGYADKVACKVLAGILHYFLLASFFWMLVEGFHLYLYIVVAYFSKLQNVKIYSLLGWGTPLLIVAISMGIRHEGYGHGKQMCWISNEHGLTWAFMGPVLLVILVNMGILFVVTKTVVSCAKVRAMEDWQHIKAGLRTVFVLLPVLGLTWIFGFFPHIVFSYLFTILNTTQGIFIFVFLIVMNSEVRNSLRNASRKRMFANKITSSSGSHTQLSKISATPFGEENEAGKRLDSLSKMPSQTESSLTYSPATSPENTPTNKAKEALTNSSHFLTEVG